MTATPPTIPIVDSLKGIGSRYRAWLVDIWGVMHNGRNAFPRAASATRAFRESGGIVVLLSNSPRPSGAVKEQLRQFGVPDEAYDAIVTSGDLTRHELGKHPGARVYHLGPERDRPIFTGLDVVLADWQEADLVVCSGLFNDDTETPEDYGDLLPGLAARALPMICANTDQMVERGHQLIYAGKPYAPVYELALETVTGLAGGEVAKDQVLAIGDGVHTDIAGAGNFGIDAVFVASGLHAPGAGGAALDAPHVAELFAQASRRPLAATLALNW